MEYHQTLPAGTVLNGEYKVIRLLGSGGFGNTYLALDTTLDREVAIKEYFPSELVYRSGPETARLKTAAFENNFKWGRDRFVQEGRTLARFRHPNIVRVFRTFDANDTSYMVLEFVNGADMEVWLKNLAHRPSQADLDLLVSPLLDALEMVHGAGILHRDIKPANIYIRKEDGAPVLLDFGAARYSVGEMTGTTAAIVSRGYSPHEGYATDAKLQGPWTDLYGLSATLYRSLSGEAPPEAAGRVLDDTMQPAAAIIPDAAAYRAEFLGAIDWGLAVLPKNRPQNVSEWRAHLLPGAPPLPAGATGPRSQPQGPASGPPSKQQARAPDSRPSGGISRPSQLKGATAPSPTIAAPPSGPPVRAIAAGLAAVLAFGGFTALAMWQTGLMPNPFAPAGSQIASNDPVTGPQQPLAKTDDLDDKRKAAAAEAERQRVAAVAQEDQRKAEEDRKREAANSKQTTEQRRKEDDRKATEERQRIAMLAKQAAEERDRQAREDEERARLAAISKKADDKKRKDEERKAEEERQRIAAIAKADEDRRRKEDERKEDERRADEERQRQAMIARQAEEEKRKEEARKAAEERDRQAAEEDERKRKEEERVAAAGPTGGETSAPSYAATDKPEGELFAELVKKIQSGLKDRRCYDGEVNGETVDADEALAKFNDQLQRKGRGSRTIRLASATIEDFESWMKWFNSVDGVTCSTPEPRSRPRDTDDRDNRAAPKKPKTREEKAPEARAPKPPQTPQYRPPRQTFRPPPSGPSPQDLLRGAR